MAYLASAKFIDGQIGQNAGQYEDQLSDFYNNTVFIFSSDHGYTSVETSWRKALGGNRYSGSAGHLRRPFTLPQKVVSNVTSLLDIFPTLLDYAGSPYPMIDGANTYLEW